MLNCSSFITNGSVWNPIRQVIQRGTFELIAQSIPVDKWVTDKLPLNDLYQLKFEGQIFSGERVVCV